METCLYDSGVNVGGVYCNEGSKLLIFLLLLLISYTIFFSFRRLSYTPRYLNNTLDEICIVVTGTINNRVHWNQRMNCTVNYTHRTEHHQD